MSIRNKIIGTFIIIIAFSLFSTIFTSVNIVIVKDNVDLLDEKDFAGITVLLEADRDSYQSNLALLQIITNGVVDTKTMNKGVKENLLQVKQRFAKFKKLLFKDLKSNKGKFEEFNTLYDNVNKHSNKILSLVESKDIKSARSYYFEKYLKDYDTMRDTINFFTDETYKVVKANKTDTGDIISLLLKSFVIISVIVILVAIFFSIYLSKSINTSISNFQKELLNFFRYINKEISSIALLDTSKKDEISQMAEVVNKNIIRSKKLIEQDDMVLNDVKNVVNLVKSGHLKQEVKATTTNESLEELKSIINEMLLVISRDVCEDLNEISKAFEEYNKLNFVYTINTCGKTADGLNSLANTITKILVENKTNGLHLQNSANKLLENMDSLNSASNKTAASLEETAASIDEITATVSKNNESINKMTNYSKEVTNAVHSGEELANETSAAMDELNEQVTAINEAISVIDQIAFQTNILSLNAAVEAATAGEAGKGFAVVAAEVRNLASRSAEAAKEIKDLVENATNKAGQGKEIADTMISGYTKLNENIQKTISLIDSVSGASKEQKAGIEQINDVVAVIDQQTQENASVAEQTTAIAIQTQDLANSIVTAANEKEFIGKNDIQVNQI